jgi:hypothetical protein
MIKRQTGTRGLKEAAAPLEALLAAKGVTEEELVADFKRWRKGKGRRALAKGWRWTPTS